MTLDELIQAALDLAKELPKTERNGDHFRHWNEAWQARITEISRERNQAGSLSRFVPYR
jgi:hypothetical protein